MNRDLPPSPDGRSADLTLARQTVIVVLVALALVALAALLWRLQTVVLLAFGAVLVAAILHAIADPIAKRTPLSRSGALPLAGLLILVVLGGAIWLVQARVRGEIGGALDAASRSIPALGEAIGAPDLGDRVARHLREALGSGSLLGQVTSFGMAAVGAVADAIVILFGGAYIAAQPRLYRDGLLKLFPDGARERVGDTLDTAARALKFWLLGQLGAMVVTGAMTWAALALIGLPSAPGLALVAAVFEFIPLLGPFLGAIPTMLVAFSQGTSTVLWTALAFLVVQQVESNVIQPLITRKAVAIPPALLLFAVIAFGFVFGVLGVVLAAPLTVVVYVGVKKLYVRRTLGEPTSVPGER